MNIDSALNRLVHLIKSDLPHLEKKSILQNENGTYTVFGQYVIIPLTTNVCRVDKNNTFRAEFSSVRSALSWCIAEKYKQYDLGQAIILLETKKLRLMDDLSTRSFLVEKIKDSKHRYRAELKLQDRRDNLQLVNNELSKCINLAKYWQIQGFNNETSRTGRTASQRANR